MMKKNEVVWYSQHTRQAPIAILLIIFSIIKSLIRTWWPFILILIFQSNFLSPERAKILVGIVTTLVVIFSIWRYYRFYFFIEGDKLHVNSGVFTRVKLDIPFDRIQTISFEQNLIHQIFHVARLKIDTAGSSKEEFEFTALEIDKAKELRQFILARRGHQVIPNTKEEDSSRLMLNLEIGDLLRVGISQNHFRTTGIILAFLLGLRDRISDSLGAKYVDQFDSVAEQLMDNVLVYGLGLFIVILILSFFGTLVYTILRYYNLKLWKSKDGYRLESGLLNIREQAVRDQKIQIIRWVSNPIRDLFRIVQLRFYQASSSSGSSKTSMTVPGVPREHLKIILERYFSRPVDTLVNNSHKIHHSFFIRRFIYLSLIPSLFFLALTFLSQQLGWLALSLTWLVVIGIFQFYLQRKWRYYINSDSLLTKYGVFERMNRALLLRKVQGVQIRQSPYQRRKALSTLLLHTASGDIKIPYIQLEQALRIKNFVLYKVETSRYKWM
ncbi:MAG: PH domain-containing protein [Saprospiraceae bacterium]|nr:PH domain-containing protein [Saprospiraceae bacterium]